MANIAVGNCTIKQNIQLSFITPTKHFFLSQSKHGCKSKDKSCFDNVKIMQSTRSYHIVTVGVLMSDTTAKIVKREKNQFHFFVAHEGSP